MKKRERDYTTISVNNKTHRALSDVKRYLEISREQIVDFNGVIEFLLEDVGYNLQKSEKKNPSNLEIILKNKYEEMGYDVIRLGKPDLILLKNNEIEFVEVKSKQDKVRDTQKEAIALLNKHGFKARVERKNTVDLIGSK